MLVILEYLNGHFIEFLATITGIICVYLNTRENVWGWPIGIVSVGLSIQVYWEALLLSDALLHIIYVILGFYGWYQWLHGKSGNQKLKISTTKLQEWLLLLIIGSVSSFILGSVMKLIKITIAVPYLDAITTCFSLLAQWQLAKKRLENWLLWIGVDILASGIYLYKGLYFFTVLYLVYLILATIGYLKWKKKFLSFKSIE